MTQKLYTIGEIHRRKMLLNQEGKPYRDKATITRIVRMYLKFERITTKYGTGYAVPASEIHSYNKRSVRSHS